MDVFLVKGLVEELEKLKNKRVKKVQTLGEGKYRIRIGEEDLIVEIGKRIYLSSYKVSGEKDGFSEFLKKVFENKILKDVYQKFFDRVIVFSFENGNLIVEAFSHWNLIVTDPEFNILKAYMEESWKDREIKVGQKYVFPKKEVPKEFEEFKERFSKEKSAFYDILEILNLPPAYVEEMCFKAGINKNESIGEASLKKVWDVWEEFLKKEIKPCVQSGNLFAFELETKGKIEKSFESVSKALEGFFEEEDLEKQKILRKLEMQKKALEALEKEIREMQVKAFWMEMNRKILEDAIKLAKENKLEELGKLGFSKKGKYIIKNLDEEALVDYYNIADSEN
ncbi:MAG: NFACT family protein [archaeon]